MPPTRQVALSARRKSKLPARIGRDAFLYFDPHANGDERQFAQCSTCRMFVPESALDSEIKGDRCIVLGSKQQVDESMSCGLYAIWPAGTLNPETIENHAAGILTGIAGSATAEEVGLVDRPVRCENCMYFDPEPSKCGLYEKLNKAMPAYWDLDPDVNKFGCCNANMARTESERA